MDYTDIISEIKANKKTPNLQIKIKKEVERFTELLYNTLFDTGTLAEDHIEELAETFEELVKLSCWKKEKPCAEIWEDYLNCLPNILDKLNKDAEAILEGDPASKSIQEIYLAYPGFYAIAIYRLAHPLYKMNFPLVPRLMTEFAHSKTGVDINPGAQIGEYFFIDHATGVVIGETTLIKDHVKIYQGVTLGALSVDKDMANNKRHPTIESGVTIYANATILGGNTTIGANTVIGGNAWVTSSIAPNSMVFHKPEIQIKNNG
jgi:serine O-acetyltransferase